MREKKNSLAMGLGVHGGRRVRMGTENGERERVGGGWLVGNGVESERVWQWGGEKRS